MHTIAKAAGVGQGTLYRHFPDRQALLIALIGRSLDRLEAFAAEQDGANLLFRFLRFYASHAREHAALASYWRVADQSSPALVAARSRLIALVEPMLERAVEAQLCRPDMTIADILSVLSMLNAIPTSSPDEALLSSLDRVLELLVGGLQRR
uniref:TetR/AcrR family transcriptional regulator n=1 Tax=Sphingomonas sp. PL-96 TaxID=2887201 RepID=UPI001E2FC378|nr:TetR/AcrR family transcriptional regulator [Sphingomonas sp. PL-96]